jgi:organic radical activating enzyme
MNVKSSYTAASAIPVKLYRDLKLLKSIAEGRIPPHHMQVCPTNRCNLKCPWCSCSERDKSDELTEDQLIELVSTLEDLSTRAITITGGGEPLLHPSINLLLRECHMAGIKIGLVSNGLAARRLDPASIRLIDWCRVSFSDTRDWSRVFEQSLEYLQGENCHGLAFSYVLTNEVNIKNLVHTVHHAVEHDYTHVRIVDDILHPSPRSMEQARQALQQSGLPLDRVIFQPRSEYTHGMKQCRLSLLKPLVAPDGYIYPCCGVQYALPDETCGFPVRMRMGQVEGLRNIIDMQQVFDGSICKRCFYSEHNEALASLSAPIDHVDFV